MRRPLATLFCALTLLFIVGCFETEIPVIPAEQAKVDLKYVGDFAATDHAGGSPFTIAIRNLDDHAYYVEYHEDGKNSVKRFVGHLADVKGGTVVHLRALADDGHNEAKFTLLRISLDGDSLSLRNFDEDFLKDKPFKTGDELKTILEANWQNEALFKGENITANRVASPKD